MKRYLSSTKHTDVGLIVMVLNELEARAMPNSTTLATAVTAVLSIKWAWS
jgi:hypothetical protein